VNDACPSVPPTTFLNDASPSDEEEEYLFTQPEAKAEAIDLTVESDPPKQKATTQGKTPNTKKSKEAHKVIDVVLTSYSTTCS
jgi:hypothetical protein